LEHNKTVLNVCLQGGMDPKLLLNNEGKLFDEVDKYLNIFNNSPYIFNLGHGLLPETNPDVLKKVIERVSSYK
jgi:uroporphyrinogen decarboxylase